MRKFSIMAVLTFNVLMLNVFSEITYAAAGDDDIHFHAPVVEPIRGNVSSEDQQVDRATKLRAKIKAIEERRLHPQKKAAEPVPLYRKNVRGNDNIKAKMRLSKEAGKRGTEKLQSYLHAVFGGCGTPESRHDKRKLTFKERLKQEIEKQRSRKKKHE